MKIKELFLKYKELIMYVIFGAGTTLVNFVVFKLFNVIMGEKYYMISNIIAWFFSVVFAYVTNKLWVFESKSWKASIVWKEVISFFAARVFSFLIEEGGLYLFVDILDFDRFKWTIFGVTIGGKMISKLLLAVIVVILNYFFSKLVIFKNKRRENKNVDGTEDASKISEEQSEEQSEEKSE